MLKSDQVSAYKDHAVLLVGYGEENGQSSGRSRIAGTMLQVGENLSSATGGFQASSNTQAGPGVIIMRHDMMPGTVSIMLSVSLPNHYLVKIAHRQ